MFFALWSLLWVQSVEQPVASTEESPSIEDRNREWWGGQPWGEWERATGDWGGLRTQLEQSGIYLEAVLIWEPTRVFRGVRKRTTSHSLLAGSVAFDLETLCSLEGGTVFAEYYRFAGASSTRDVGDFQVFSNIDVDENRDQVSELWYQQQVGEKLRLKLGKQDANNEFAYVDSLGYFIHSSAGFSPTVFPFPTYPEPATGVSVFWDVLDGWSLSFGLFDGANTVDGVKTGSRGPSTFFSNRLSDDYFFIAESSVFSEGEDLPFRLKLGAWYHNGKFETFEGGRDRGTFGFYGLQEWRLFQGDEGSRLWGSAQLARSDPEVSESEWHGAVGLVLESPLRSRPADATGIYVSHAHFTDESGAGFDNDETAFEWFYRFQLTGSTAIQGQLSYIDNPGGDAALDDALAASLRVEVVL